MRSLVDAGFRLAYRLGFRAMRGWWYLLRPPHQGVVVAVCHAGRVLLLQQSYRDTLDFPGGGVQRGEAPLATAQRELAEETGIAVPPAALRLVTEISLLWDYRQDRVAIFELRLVEPPRLRLDGREIVGAEFMTREAALAAPISPFVRAYFAAAGVP
jgi:8-oxo-dGTP diphosphatase